MTYQEILEIVDNYLTVTGIREFCREVCKGICCGDSNVPCHATETYNSTVCDLRLPCVLFLCDYPEAHVINYIENGEPIVDLLREIDLIICKKVREIEQTNAIYQLDSQEHMTLVFDIPDISLLLNPTRQEVFFDGNID